VNWGVLIVATLGFLSSLLGYLATRQKISKVDGKVDTVDGKVDGVHELVNSQHDDLVDRLDKSERRGTQLTGTLNAAGVQVPDPPS
jgi:hypothetical protein